MRDKKSIIEVKTDAGRVLHRRPSDGLSSRVCGTPGEWGG